MALDQEIKNRMVAIIHAQDRSAQTWINFYMKNKDGANIKNALYALGKVYGAYNALLNLMRDEDMPEEIIELICKRQPIYDEMMSTYLVRGETGATLTRAEKEAIGASF